jgi:hypothetical protein
MGPFNVISNTRITEKYFPGLGAVNIPVEGFMAFPTLVLVISNGMTELVVEKTVFFCT